jgi:hypothetical protein
MSKAPVFPTIPYPDGSPAGVDAALRAIKQTLEILTGQVTPGGSSGVPQVFMAYTAPAGNLRGGDIWFRLSDMKQFVFYGDSWQATT